MRGVAYETKLLTGKISNSATNKAAPTIALALILIIALASESSPPQSHHTSNNDIVYIHECATL